MQAADPRSERDQLVTWRCSERRERILLVDHRLDPYRQDDRRASARSHVGFLRIWEFVVVAANAVVDQVAQALFLNSAMSATRSPSAPRGVEIQSCCSSRSSDRPPRSISMSPIFSEHRRETSRGSCTPTAVIQQNLDLLAVGGTGAQTLPERSGSSGRKDGPAWVMPCEEPTPSMGQKVACQRRAKGRSESRVRMWCSVENRGVARLISTCSVHVRPA